MLVFEGRDRVGGRSFTGSVAGLPIDLGGSFVGPTQDAVQALAADLQIPTTPTHHHGKNVIRWRGSSRSYRGTIPRLSLIGLLDIGRLQWQFARISRNVPVAAPWEAQRARQLDDVSLGEWLRMVRATASSRDLMAIMSQSDLGLRTRRRFDAARGPLRSRRRRPEPVARHRERRPAGPFPGRHPADRRRRRRPNSATASCSTHRCVASSDTARG